MGRKNYRPGCIWSGMLGLTLLLIGCVKSQDADPIAMACEEGLTADASFGQVKALYDGNLLQIQEDWIIEGYVNSSDSAGNFFSELHLQDDVANPTEGFQIQIDLFDSHLQFEPGSKILIKTKGLYLDKRRGVFRMGGTFNAFGTTTVGRLPALKIQEHIFRSCEAIGTIIPVTVSPDNLDTALVNTLVRFEGMEFIEEELGLPYAEDSEETERTLKDCDDNEVVLLNSGFSDFHSEILPQGLGTVTGVLLRDNDNFFVVVRGLEDVDLSGERCPPSEVTSNTVFFSELADPNNNSGARYIELYNSAQDPVNLKGWTIRRYTNDNVEVSSTIDLSELTIGAQKTLVISPNVTAFEQVYGFVPDLGVGTNSPADSNGDDNLELVDPFGNVIDRFGRIGEDGSGTDHEFEDGRALRNATVLMANATYTFSEWTIFNDSGDFGTTNSPQNAPQDFTPGER